MKKRLLCLLLCLLTLTGCSSRIITDDTPTATLPPAEAGSVPRGTDGLTYEATVPLSLPSADGSRLLTVYQRMTLDRSSVNARAVVEALLSYPGSDEVRRLGGDITLGLYGKNPVEVSGGICTVNLSASALSLSYSEYYTLCLSLASTLAQVDGITGVNVLVCDQPAGLDIAGYLPVGTVSAHPGEDLGALWELMDARRVPLGQNPTQVALSSTVTLYYPLADGTGVMPETRSITFSGQSPAQLASGLLSAMSAGSQTLEGVCAMPDITSMLTQLPTISEQADGSRMVTLYFTGGLENRLSLLGIEPMCFTASVVLTLTTFIPNVSSVCIVSGSTMMTSLYSRSLGALSFRDGVQRRSQYAALLRDQLTLYFAQDSRLTAVTRSAAYGTVNDPAQLLTLLSEGPTEAERQSGLSPVLPEGLDDSDLLGAAIEDGVLVLHLSERAANAIRSANRDGTHDEQLLCYSLVTTLCRAFGLNRCRFCFAGDAEESLGGSIYWRGEFLINAGMLN